MTRRIAVQALLVVIAGAMYPEQKTTPTKPRPPSTPTTGSGVAFLDASKSLSLHIYLDWKDITVYHGAESVTIDQDELFQALKGKP